MAIAQEFITLPLGELRATAHRMKDEGYRFIQTHAVYNEPDVDLYYSFMKDGKITNWRIEGVTKEDAVPSITDIFLAAFVFENEARELFGVDMRDIAIDFQGALYAPAESEPMRVITPEQGDNMTEKEIIDLLFHAGFSTAKVVSDVSGRGARPNWKDVRQNRSRRLVLASPRKRQLQALLPQLNQLPRQRSRRLQPQNLSMLLLLKLRKKRTPTLKRNSR